MLGPLADWTRMSPPADSFDSDAALLDEGMRRHEAVGFWVNIRPNVGDPDRVEWAQHISPRLVSNSWII